MSPGKGTLTLTGNLGDVMKESASTALSYLQANASTIGIDHEAFAKTNVHIHVPQGAIPKDGPSAGITMLSAITSAFRKTPIKPYLAMTGEITLRGKVLPVGGIKEKVLAARRAGIREIMMCKSNRRHIAEIEPDYLRDSTSSTSIRWARCWRRRLGRGATPQMSFLHVKASRPDLHPMLRQLFLVLVLCFGVSLQLSAQRTPAPAPKSDTARLVQLSGLVLDGGEEQLASVPYANIYLPGTGRGTYTDFSGFFSIVVKQGDTVQFSAVGFAPATLIVPDTLREQRYSIVQLMNQDTAMLATAVIFPWPSRDHFKLEFLAMDVSNEFQLQAQANLAEEKLASARKEMLPDGNESGDFYLRQQARRSYYVNQTPPMNIFSPIAWGQFFKAWKEGDFTKKE